MKVPTSPISPAGADRPPARTEGGSTGRAQRDDSALQEDADLFKQAMSDTTKEPADTTRRGEPGRTRESGSETGAARAAAFQGEPGKTQERGSDAAALQGEPGRTRERGSGAAAQARAAAFQGERKRGSPAGRTRQDPGTREWRAAQAAALRGEPGKTQARGSETAAGAAGKKDAAGLESTDETGPEAGGEAQQDLQDLLATQVTQARMAAPVQHAEAAAPPAISSELVADIAQRILVSAAEHGQDKEVRIQVKDTVLNDTEVVISRQKGELVVVFETRSHTDNVLLSNSRDAMTATLQAALDGPVRIDINAESPDTDPRDRHDQRSRGMYIQEDDV